MKIEHNLKKIDIKDRACYYLDDITRFLDRDIEFSDTKNYAKKNTKIFWFLTFQKLQRVQNHCILGSIK